MDSDLIKVTRRAHAGPATARVTLPFELRQRSRLRARLDDGREVALLLERGTVLRGGDLLVSQCGLCIEVVAGPEPVSVALTATPDSLARAAYHLGNRHIPLQIASGKLLYLADHVLDEMVVGLGVEVVHDSLPFEPEAGAYAHGHGHGHGHGHSHHDEG